MAEEEGSPLELKIAKCQLKVYEDMHEVRRDMHKVVDRVSILEKGHKEIQSTLHKHEEQRRGMHKVSDEKLDAILEKVGKVESESNDNAEWISKVNKWRIKITFIVTGIVSTIGFLYWLYTFLQKHGLVIVFEKAAG